MKGKPDMAPTLPLRVQFESNLPLSPLAGMGEFSPLEMQSHS